MTIDLLQKDALTVPCDLLVVNLFQGVTRPAGATGVVDKALGGMISTLIAQDGFEGKFGQTLIFPTMGKIKAKRVAVVGLGDKRAFRVDSVRRLGGCLVKLAASVRAKSLVTIVHGAGIGGLDPKGAAQALAEGLHLSTYRFHAYHGKLRKKESPPRELASVKICEVETRTAKAAQEGIARAEILSKATNYVRDLVNTPSAEMTPLQMADEASKLTGQGVSVKIMDAKEMERKGMRATLAVGRGSAHAPVGVHLSYKPRGAKKTIALVGKAVTFDSGGLNIKTGDGMTTMKIDMAGAATVLGVFQAIRELKLPIAVHGIFLAVENMPSGSAYRPGDVVKAMDGTTIEVLNTDAEGRVTLADALSYAKTFDPDTIIDLATLTGACVVALGEDIAGLLTNSRKLSEKLLSAAEESGEALWELPLYEPYMDLIRSKIADIKNTGPRSGGTITAALFLKPFVGDTPWAHLDIAGPSYVERETRPDQPYGGSGYGVRMLVRYLEKAVR